MNIKLGSGSRATPVGAVKYAVNDQGALVALGFEEHWDALVRRLQRRFPGATPAPSRSAAAVGDALDAYLAGDVHALDGLAVDAGGTPFQQRVWTALRAVPAGTTCSYADVARAVGAPRAVRAVGAANGANPVSIVVPCHRVVASDGSLHGYGGGLERKAWLLAHEA
ncbi:MAG TPA: methylated-DNA--[protein]-cysteine S-methyltransferase [Polyangiaceae bacterium]|jgi:methylated-DNA-[protein]-cysteine S-methyltransferase